MRRANPPFIIEMERSIRKFFAQKFQSTFARRALRDGSDKRPKFDEKGAQSYDRAPQIFPKSDAKPDEVRIAISRS